MEIVQLQEVSDRDLSEVNNLFSQLTQHSKNATIEQLEGMLKSPNVEWWVARDDNKMIGMGILLVFLKSIGISAQIQEMVIDEDYRGKGIGKMIAHKMIDRAKARGATHIDLTSNPSRTAANAFYQGLGFEKRDTNVYRLKL